MTRFTSCDLLRGMTRTESLVATMTRSETPTTDTCTPSPRTKLLEASSVVTEPVIALPFSSFSDSRQSSDHEPTSLLLQILKRRQQLTL